MRDFAFGKHMLASRAQLLQMTVRTLELNLFGFVSDLDFPNFGQPFALFLRIVRVTFPSRYIFQCQVAKRNQGNNPLLEQRLQIICRTVGFIGSVTAGI